MRWPQLVPPRWGGGGGGRGREGESECGLGEDYMGEEAGGGETLQQQIFCPFLRRVNRKAWPGDIPRSCPACKIMGCKRERMGHREGEIGPM